MASRPNILFLFTDDQRFNTIHALGNEQVRTPNLDRLVARGTTFTHAHIPGGTSGAVCMPSRAMLHTGRTLFHIEGAGQGVPEEHILLGEHLQRHGYRTFGTGKWHNGKRAYARSFSDGAEIMFGGMGDHWNVLAYDHDPSGRYDTTLPICPNPAASKELRHRGADHITPGKHSSELFCDAAIRFLESVGEEPFFAYLAFMAPHDPRTMPAQFRELYDPATLPLPENFLGGHPFDNGALKIRDEILADFPRDPNTVREHLADYYGMISHLDAEIGRVLTALQATGKADNTILVFAGDNGLAVGQHGLFGKQSLYDHSVRVPLIFAGPGIPAGERRQALVYLLDIFPTLCELSGIQRPETVEGTSLVEAIRDPEETVRDRLYLAYTQFQRGVRTPRHKLIEYCVNGRRNTQLFDLQEDPWERCNLAADPAAAELLGGLRQDLVRLRDEWDDQASEWGKTFWQQY